MEEKNTVYDICQVSHCLIARDLSIMNIKVVDYK